MVCAPVIPASQAEAGGIISSVSAWATQYDTVSKKQEKTTPRE